MNPYNGIAAKKPYGREKVSIGDPLPKLMRQADIVFAKSQKKKYAVNGFVTCYTCDTKVRLSEADLGHYIDRRHYATRYDERNVRCQCQHCNRVLDGNKEIFRDRLILELGIGVLFQLEDKMPTRMKLDRHDLMDIITKYAA